MNKVLKNKQKKAFALVLALSLMGFMVLLTVSLATMVSMQLRLSKQSLNTFKARQAAKFSACQALGAIQSTLGPDQRITANAGILTQNVHSNITALDSDGEFNWWQRPMDIRREDADEIVGPIAENRYWVGVWHSKHGYHPEKQLRTESRESFTQNVMDKAITWLVSGNEFATNENVRNGSTSADFEYLPTKPLKEGTYVRAVTKNSFVGLSGKSDGSEDVRVPLVELTADANDSTGIERSTGKQVRIAWWVSDEGQKASLNANASVEFRQHSSAIKYRVQSMPFFSGIQGLTVGDSSDKMYDVLIDDDGSDGSGMMIARNASSIDQLDAIKSSSVPDSIVPSKMLFHAATCDSKGLLVNVRDGGLKKDLSLGLIQTDGKNDANMKTTEKENGDNAPDYFPRPYGVSGFFTKTTAFPIKYLSTSEWAGERRAKKPTLEEKIGKRSFAGHIFGPQMFGREEEISKYPSMSFRNNSAEEWGKVYADEMLWKDPGGALWDQLRSYYNLRAPDSPKESTISSRVQTDDRYGAKPVVKRFSVHYVPTLVDYGGQKYGLRFHIIPLLVLWNPYDTKIGEDAYYVIRVSNRDFCGMRSQIGVYRFAIGYEVNGYFQCLRDLFTERMRFLSSRSDLMNLRSDNIDYLRKNGFYTSKFGFYGGNYNFTSGTTGWSQSATNSQGKSQPFYDVNSSTYDYRSSKYTAFYQRTGYSGSNKANWYPLGYGGIARHYIKSIVLSGGGKKTTLGNNNFQSNIFPKQFDTNLRASDNYDWESVVQEDNMWPKRGNSLMQTYHSETLGQESIKNWARVAKIPLYLNNLYAHVGHGGYNTRKEQYPDVTFYGQRGIEAVDIPDTFASIVNSVQGYYWTLDLHFLAHDPTGINAGATKVFAMQRIINYLGNSKLTSNDSGKNGPNGIIEDQQLSESPYKRLDAMMLPVGEGADSLGGCFYLDVPHPELEHYAKYTTNNKPIIMRFNQNPDAVETGTEIIENPYILFDLNDIRQANSVDAHGKSSGSINISDIRVDMNEVTIFCPQDTNERISTLGMATAMTPMAYGISRYGSGNALSQGDANNVYPELQLSVWIYKKEGMTFTKMDARSDKKVGNMFADYVPLLVHMKGRRNFLGAAYPSFPNPAMHYSNNCNTGKPGNYRREIDQFNNWHTAGFVPTSQGGGSTARMRLVSLEPPTFYDSIDNYYESGNFKYDEVKRYLNENTPESENLLTGTQKSYLNGKYFINWLPLNPRRHSANFWKMRSRVTSNSNGVRDQIGDLNPESILMSQSVILNSSDASNNSYESKLHSKIQGNSRYIPYALVFALPFANTEEGASPIHNRRMFVNGSMLATSMGEDYNAQEIRNDDPVLQYSRAWGRSNKNIIATSMVYTDSDKWEGFSDMGYKHAGPSNNSAYIGLTPKSGTTVNASHHILREDEVVHNVANLSGANLNFGAGKWGSHSNWEGGLGSAAMSTGPGQPWRKSYGLNPPEGLMASLAIGNSLCPSRVCPEYTFHQQWLDGSCLANDFKNKNALDYGDANAVRQEGEDKNVVYDLSWHMNDALWDEYFFSTLPYRVDDEKNNFNTGRSLAMPQNPRIQYICTDHDHDTLTLPQMKYSEEESDAQFDENAGKLWVNGAFNVNSTSVDAWKIILSTYYGQTIEGYEGGSTENKSSAPFHRWSAPLNGDMRATADTNITDEERIFTGYRALSDSEIEELAVSIVEHIKDRGPFYSMSDFVNRLAANYSAEEKYSYKLASEEDLLTLDNQKTKEKIATIADMMKKGGETYRVGHMQKGVLQAAIDATSINSAYHDRYIVGSEGSSLTDQWKLTFDAFNNDKDVWENWRGVVGPAATGAPTYLMQQDILSRLGSILTVRSDTFKIRAYGEVRNPVSGVVESKAWCEVLVQRMPEYMDSTDSGNEAVDVHGREKELGYQHEMKEYNTIQNDLTQLNQALGRRFKIVSFRWLSDSEI